jgi:hypothetical protein
LRNCTRGTLAGVRIRRLVGAAIVAICVIVPLVESFDSWDRTVQDGNDTEANVVIAALCIGVALSAATTIVVVRIRALPTDARFRCIPRTFRSVFRSPQPPPSPGSSPPLVALRI